MNRQFLSICLCILSAKQNIGGMGNETDRQCSASSWPADSYVFRNDWKAKNAHLSCGPFSYLVLFSCRKLSCLTQLFLFSCRSGRWRGPASENISYGCSSAGCLAVHFLVLDKLLFIYCNLALIQCGHQISTNAKISTADGGGMYHRSSRCCGSLLCIWGSRQ